MSFNPNPNILQNKSLSSSNQMGNPGEPPLMSFGGKNNFLGPDQMEGKGSIINEN